LTKNKEGSELLVFRGEKGEEKKKKGDPRPDKPFTKRGTYSIRNGREGRKRQLGKRRGETFVGKKRRGEEKKDLTVSRHEKKKRRSSDDPGGRNLNEGRTFSNLRRQGRTPPPRRKTRFERQKELSTSSGMKRKPV